MTFHPLTIGAETFNEVGPGRYMHSSVTFGNPKDYIQIKGGTYNSKTKITTASVSSVTEKSIPDSEALDFLSIQVIIQSSHGFVTQEIDSKLLRISDFLDEAVLNRLMQGEQ